MWSYIVCKKVGELMGLRVVLKAASPFIDVMYFFYNNNKRLKTNNGIRRIVCDFHVLLSSKYSSPFRGVERVHDNYYIASCCLFYAVVI